MAAYEIWIGNYHLGQGSHPPSEPELVGRVVAPNFPTACYIYELETHLNYICQKVEEGVDTSYDKGYMQWNYDPKTNSNSWTGPYYQTKEEALKSFQHG